MNTWVIGDIHGCLKTFKALLNKMPESWDKLVLLGDYIDRGPDSKGVVDLVQELQSKHNVVALKGNHEDMCLHAYQMYEHNSYDLASDWGNNGSDTTLDSFNRKVPQRYLDWMLGLPLKHEDELAYYVHAGFWGKVTAEYQTNSDMLWIRGAFLNHDHDFGKPVIHGHTAFKVPQITKNRISLDTGCVYRNTLTAYCVQTGEVISIPCEDFS